MPETDETFDATRTTLQRVAVHIVARARVQASGRFSLRVTPGGFGTPEFGADARRVRVSGDVLVVESDAFGAPSSAAHPIDGSTLATLARAADVDLGETIDVGHDTPQVGDSYASLRVDPQAAAVIGSWFSVVNSALDHVVSTMHAAAEPTPVRLWPEHFDVATDAAARDGVRVNLGGSPGDGFCAEPYLYVGPWTADRPGATEFWNAPFGAFLPAAAISGDLLEGAIAFLSEGYRFLAD